MKNSDRHFQDNQSKEYQDAVLALKRLVDKEGDDSATRAYGQAVWEERRRDFGKINKVKESSGHLCLPSLLADGKIRCNGIHCHASSIPACDHPSMWSKGGKTQEIVLQPYRLSMQDMDDIVKFCTRYGLNATITAGSWHFPGKTLLVEFSRKSEVKQ